jgi:hypothetical protein
MQKQGTIVIPNELIQEIKQNCCVPFLGAGISTEGPYYKRTFFEHIKGLCNYPKRINNPAFPDVMQYYCEKIDGGRKNKLIREIINWIEHFAIEGEPNRVATMFHRDIARIPYFKIIVTTNWDPFCERVLNVLVPMVEDKDIPFWDDQKRQVLKIHGCITRPQTIVATREDYEKCMTDKTKGAIFTRLRDLMAIKTFIFVGFSISDPDFQIIYDEVISNLGEFRRGSWVIDPSPNEHTINEWKKRGVRILKINGIAFARELTRRLEKDRVIPSEELIRFFEGQLYRFIEIHMQTSEKQELPSMFSSSMYQDGIIHSLEHLIEDSRIGKSMDGFANQLNEYRKILGKYQRKLSIYERNPQSNKPNNALIEVAYWSGRVEALKRFISNNRRNIPAYFRPYALKPTNKM